MGRSSGAGAAFAAGRLMIRTSYRLTAAIGGTALVIGAAMLILLGPDTDPFWPAAAGFVMGIGMGFCNTTFIVATQTLRLFVMILLAPVVVRRRFA